MPRTDTTQIDRKKVNKLDEMPEVKTITVVEAAKRLPKGPEWLRAGLRQGRFPFGTAVQGKTGRWNYIIFEKKFCNYLKENN